MHNPLSCVSLCHQVVFVHSITQLLDKLDGEMGFWVWMTQLSKSDITCNLHTLQFHLTKGGWSFGPSLTVPIQSGHSNDNSGRKPCVAELCVYCCPGSAAVRAPTVGHLCGGQSGGPSAWSLPCSAAEHQWRHAALAHRLCPAGEVFFFFPLSTGCVVVNVMPREGMC